MGGRPWSATIYTSGKAGQQDLLRRLADVAASGRWTVKLEGQEQSADDLQPMVDALDRPDLVVVGQELVDAPLFDLFGPPSARASLGG